MTTTSLPVRPAVGALSCSDALEVGRRGKATNGSGVVTPLRTCDLDSECYAENQLRRLPLPAGDYTPGDMVVSSVHAQLSRCGRPVGGARDSGLVRDRSALGKSFRSHDRSRFAQAPPQAIQHLA